MVDYSTIAFKSNELNIVELATTLIYTQKWPVGFSQSDGWWEIQNDEKTFTLEVFIHLKIKGNADRKQYLSLIH